MNPTVIVIGKLILASGLLTGFYYLFFRGKSSYRAARLFLLTVPLASFALAFARFEGGGLGVSFASLTEIFQQEAPETAIMDMPALPRTMPVEVPEAVVWGHILPTGIYLTGVLVLIFLNIRQSILLRRLHRGAERSTEKGVRIWCGGGIGTPFSVFRAIYLPAGLSAERRAVVLAHEKQHIAHRHDIDLMVMELFAVFGWFVPLVWIVRRELRQVHEFEADRATLADGVAMSDLMAALLAETAGFVPAAANPFCSILKKRFQQMKTPKKIRWSALRGALTTAFGATLVLFFATSPVEAEESGGVTVARSVSLPREAADSIRIYLSDQLVIREQVLNGNISSEEGEKKIADLERKTTEPYAEYTITRNPSRTPTPEMEREIEALLEDIGRELEREMEALMGKYNRKMEAVFIELNETAEND